MPPLSFELRERFHLTLLYYISLRLANRPYAVKGGICLRFFHRSQRLSEDMDIDVSSQVRQKTLEDAIDSVIKSQSFNGSLLSRGISRIETRKPKQTETTQRWKFTLYSQQALPLPTKIEFSRRHIQIPYSTGIPDQELLKTYKMHPFAARFYDSNNMCIQKIQALSSPTRHAVRDLFDLDHLFSSTVTFQCKFRVKYEDVEKAAHKVADFSTKDFKEQVLPYLSESLESMYADSAAFDNLKRRVEEHLLEIMCQQPSF